MPFKKILDNLYLGDQFSNTLKIDCEVKMSDIFYRNLCKRENIIFKNSNVVITKDKLAANIVDCYHPTILNKHYFLFAINFIKQNIKQRRVYVHCQLGVSRSASLIFIYLVIENIINIEDFNLALNHFIDNFYPYMKLNSGIYLYLKENFPFQELKNSLNESSVKI
ncbi:dual specificity protein phosphatase family protein [Spiroplasma apis]|uniref:Tyrosine specific protein phosphatases domain-containing protein n=1 Tax=Spiroplasma apis B31 TaxID=1276258 RepID=V5RJM4_SPIAP|nr:dual specificity protein phosphatase family protein [Spiroplasma apis]AHB36673.1 hypothetical protein SAPIS_v1c08280 [Spiroplasma apis B31]